MKITFQFHFPEHRKKQRPNASDNNVSVAGIYFSLSITGDCWRLHFLGLINVIALISLISLEERKLSSQGIYYMPRLLCHSCAYVGVWLWGKAYIAYRNGAVKEFKKPFAPIPQSNTFLPKILMFPQVLTSSLKYPCLMLFRRWSNCFYGHMFH